LFLSHPFFLPELFSRQQFPQEPSSQKSAKNIPAKKPFRKTFLRRKIKNPLACEWVETFFRCF
jgi:hypothetical protein